MRERGERWVGCRVRGGGAGDVGRVHVAVAAVSLAGGGALRARVGGGEEGGRSIVVGAWDAHDGRRGLVPAAAAAGGAMLLAGSLRLRAHVLLQVAEVLHERSTLPRANRALMSIKVEPVREVPRLLL